MQAAAQHLSAHAAGLELLQARKAAQQDAFLNVAVRSSACYCSYILSPAAVSMPGAVIYLMVWFLSYLVTGSIITVAGQSMLRCQGI